MSNLFLARCQRSQNGRRDSALLFGGGEERQVNLVAALFRDGLGVSFLA